MKPAALTSFEKAINRSLHSPLATWPAGLGLWLRGLAVDRPLDGESLLRTVEVRCGLDYAPDGPLPGYIAQAVERHPLGHRGSSDSACV